QCALCHADIDAKKPKELQVASLFEGESFRAAHASREADEIQFSHLSHATRGLDCTACHAEVARDEGTLAGRSAELRMSMETCLACHDTSAGPRESDCAACHAE